MPSIRRLLPAALVVLASWAGPGVVLAGKGTVTKGPVPTWVEPRRPDLSPTQENLTSPAGVHLLLLDSQENTKGRQRFSRQVIRILNERGVEAFSDITLDYNPAFESLSLHHIRVHRGGRSIEKLVDHDIRTYQREPGLESGRYRGEVTTVVNLRDIRSGDVLDYAYTRTGDLPLLAGHISRSYLQQGVFPVREWRLRVMVDAATAVRVHLLAGAEAPRVVEGSGGREYLWAGQDVPALASEATTPSWFYSAPIMSLTTFADWSEVAEWAEPLYRLSSRDLSALKGMADSILVGRDREERTLAAIQFVQDQVRYLARAEGLWAYQPRKPAICLSQRSGDCKDKSLLLCALLRLLDVEAEPLLVSTMDRGHVGERSPSPYAFDHCVVAIRRESGSVYIDPTWSGQGGDLDHRAFPAYRQGLPIRRGAAGLEELPEPPVRRIEVIEEIVAPEAPADSAFLTVITRYHGAAADEKRSEIAGSDLGEIGRSYERFYSTVYPGIRQREPVAVHDDERQRVNMVTVIEWYGIRNIWQPVLGDTARLGLLVSPIDLEAFLVMAASPARRTPYHAGTPIDFEFRASVRFPQSKDLNMKPVRIAGTGYSYVSSVKSEGTTVFCNYHYRRDIEDVPAEDAPAFIAAHDRMLEDLDLYIFDMPRFRLSWAAVGLSLAGLGIAGWLARRLARVYDPEPPQPSGAPRPIGGWLILPAIGIAVRPLIQLIELLTGTEIYNAALWSGEGVPLALPFVWALLGIETLIQVLFLAWAIFVAVLFFGRRSSLPVVYVTFLVAFAAWGTVDHLLAVWLFKTDAVTGWRDVIGAWIAVAIWVPYFKRSQRVRETFVTRAGGETTERAPITLPSEAPAPPIV